MKKNIAFTSVLVFASFLCTQVALAQNTKSADSRNNAVSVTPLNRKISVKVENVPLSTFLDVISSQTKVKFLLGGDFGAKKVTAYLTNKTIKEVLDIVLPIQGLSYETVDGTNTIVIVRRGNAGTYGRTTTQRGNVVNYGQTGTSTQGTEEVSLLDRRVSIRVANVPFRVLLNSLTAQMRGKINLVADSSVSEMRVTLKASNITCRDALELISKQYNLRYYTSNDNSYVFTR
ncbi:MAG: hypothetical protein J5594_01990 [Elusimicrobiaceae bacterium]|nr:hypothetical protein [Elusimicrobiaceae bacterium]